MSRSAARALLGALLCAGAFLRLSGLNWDEGHHLHPDERFLSMVEEKLAFPRSPAEYLDSARSPLNPYNRGYDSFVYGTLPVFLTKAFAVALKKDGYDGAHLVGRAASALFDLVTVWLVYRIARRFSGRVAALASAALLAFCPLALQLSHFWAVDTFLAAFAAAALLGTVRIAEGRAGPLGAAATGAALGLAVACKVTALALLAPLGIALLLGIGARKRDGTGAALGRAFLLGVVAVVAAAVAVRFALPYAFRGFGLDPRYLKDMKNLAALSNSVAGFPPALQWAGRTVLFPVENFLLWGAAPLFGFSALAGLAAAALGARAFRKRGLLPLVAYAATVGAYHALALVKSVRYFYPAYPVLAVVGGIGLAALARADSRRAVWRGLAAFVLVGHALTGVAFTAIYRNPHPRIEASRWIYAHVPPPARFGNEAWDDGQPIPLPDHDPAGYAGPVLALFDPDDSKKAEALLATLRGSDWIAVTSNRVYGNVTRIPEVFPATTAYYRALFEDRLGFVRAAEFTSYPRLGPLRFPDDGAEEQFTVYDHPRVLLFRKAKDFSEKRVRAILFAALTKTPPTIWDWEKRPPSRRTVTRPVRPGPAIALERSVRAGPPAGGKTGSLAAAGLWYVALFAIGATAFPITRALFSRFPMGGLGLSRIVGLTLSTYVLSLGATRHVVPHGRAAALLAMGLVAAIGALLFAVQRREILSFFIENRREILVTEALFLAGYVVFLAFRAANPEIAWGEKPMDFSILNILVRTRSLPASDPWFAGAPLGYYTFGQEMVASVTLATGLSTRYTFNLAFGMLAGLSLAGAYSLARTWAGTRRAGLAAAGFLVFLGNLSGLREWWMVRRPQKLPLDWNYFWATSRVIKDTINEYPFWSFLFADLHAHVLALPLLLLCLAAALQLVRVHADPGARSGQRVLAAALLGFLAGAEALTNAWDVPFLAGLLFLTALVTALARGVLRGRALVRAIVALAIAVATAAATALPLWARGGGPPAFGWNAEKAAAGTDVATVFGFFFFLAFAWWSVRAAHSLAPGSGLGRAAVFLLAAALLVPLVLRSSELLCLAGTLLFVLAALVWGETSDDRLALGLVATGFFLALFPQRVYLYDRMNTFFKLSFEAWIVFAIATAVLLFRNRSPAGTFRHWPPPWKAVFLLLLSAGLFTSVTGARGAIARSRPTFHGPAAPTLDGLAYLDRTRPGEALAVAWIQRSIRGTPVILEAQGPSYQEFGRVSMLTGLPTVLGWEYHVQQRGNRPDDIADRRAAVERIYASPSSEKAELLLRRYHVGYVYVGDLERRTYPAAGLSKFEADRELFGRVYENADVRVYRVVGADAEDVLAPARDVLPEKTEAAAAEVLEPGEAPTLLAAAVPGVPPFAGLKEPRDGAVDRLGRIWIADFGNSRVKVFDREGGLLGGWGGRGDGTYNLREPSGIAIQGQDVYVADTWNGRVQAFSLAGEWRAVARELYGPRGVAAGPDGNVWVTDTGNHRVVRYDRTLGNPRVLGKKGPGALEFSSPVGIAVGPSGDVYVCDTGNARIVVMDPEGAFRRAIPLTAWKGSVEPHLEVGARETLYVTDPASSSVLVVGGSGNLLQRFDGDDAGRHFANPMGIALDEKDRILYVINSGGGFVSRKRLSEPKGD